MKEFLEYTGWIGLADAGMLVSGIVRILLAGFLGALIGLERGRKQRPAGLRTHMLVCVAAALVMVTNEQMVYVYGSGDPTRMGAQVISGVGFLGAGTILTDRQSRIRGLTTAAGVWASACVGLAVGGGFYIGGIVSCILMLAIFTKLQDVEHMFNRRGRLMDVCVYFDGARNLNHFICDITNQGCSILSLEYMDGREQKLEKESARSKKVIGANLQILLPKSNYHAQILKMQESSKGMISMEEN